MSLPQLLPFRFRHRHPSLVSILSLATGGLSPSPRGCGGLADSLRWHSQVTIYKALVTQSESATASPMIWRTHSRKTALHHICVGFCNAPNSISCRQQALQHLTRTLAETSRHEGSGCSEATNGAEKRPGMKKFKKFLRALIRSLGIWIV